MCARYCNISRHQKWQAYPRGYCSELTQRKRGSEQGKALAKGLRCWAVQVPKREARPMRVSDPLGLRVPPLILRAMTRGRTLRSAKLLWAGTPGTATKTKSSGKNCSTRSHKVFWGARVWA